MAKRDVQLVVRARNEADRAIDSISAALRTLTGVQDEVSGSGERTSNTLEKLAGAFSAIDSAVQKIDQSVGTASASFAAQQAALAENEARYAALTRQIGAAEQAIINTRIAMQSDASPELAARLAGAQQAYRGLVAEAERLGATITAQRARVDTAAADLHQLEAAATAARLSIGEFGDESKREALQTAAANREAAEARRERYEAERAAVQAEQELLRDRIAAARQEVAARKAQAEINERLGVRNIEPGAAAASAAVFEQEARAKRDSARASDEMATAAARLRAKINPLAAMQDRVNREVEEAKRLYHAGHLSLLEYVQTADRLEKELRQLKNAQDEVNNSQARGSKNRNAPAEIKNRLGLRPYETQNLLYQINDVITQLGSGAPLGQVFAQQGGQILQLFPKVLDLILKYWRGLTLVGVALAPVVIGMKRLNEVAARQRDFAANLALSADNARYNVDALMENVEALDAYGASAEDATAAVKTFVSEAVNPERLDEFGRAAQDLAEITGQDLTDAAEDVAKAFTGGYEAVAEFDDKLNFLTLSEREQIRAMFDSGKEAEARALAFARFYDQVKRGAEETRTAWDRMVRAMSAVWADFKDYLADTSFLRTLRDEIDNVAIGATYLLNRIRGLTHEAAALDALGIESPRQRGGITAGLNALSNAGFLRVDPLDADSERERKRRSDEAYEEAQKKIRNRRGGKTDADYQRDFNRELERANREREIEAQQLERTNVLRGRALIEEQRRQAIADAIRAAEDKASKDAKRKLTFTAAQRAEIERTVGLEFDARHAKALAQAEQEEHERKVNDLLARRRELLAAIEFTSPGSAQFGALQTALLGLNVQIEEATQSALEFWKALLDNPSADLINNTNFVVRPTIDPSARPRIANEDGSFSTIETTSFESDLGEVLIPTIVNGVRVSFEEAIKHFEATGEHLGIFATPEEADNFARALSEAQGHLGNLTDPNKLALLGKTREEVEAIVAALENQMQGIRRDVLKSAAEQAEAGLDDLRAMQSLLQEQIEFAQLQGESGRAGRLAEQLVEVNDRLAEGARKAIEFWQSVRGSPEDLAIMGLTPEAVDNIILGLENTIAASERLRTQFLKTGEAINQDLATGGANALDQFAQSLANGENAIASLGRAFLQFAADFLLNIGRMIAQQAIFNALAGGSPGGTGGVGGFIAGAIGGLFHGGGVVSGGGRSRRVAAAMFSQAARYHGGGIAGLKPDEVPAILQRGEEVLTRDDARHRRNAGKGGRGLAQILAIGEDQIAQALAGAAGREVILTHLRTERATIRQELGLDG